MYGELGLKLVQHAKRTQALATLPGYQAELVRAAVREVRELERDVGEILAPFAGQFDPAAEPAAACALLVDHLCMRRTKRCLLAYHRVRAERLEALCWAGRDALPDSGDDDAAGSADTAAGSGSAAGSAALSPEELDYMRRYTELLAAYKGRWTDIDLAGSLEPPTDLFVDVRVLRDAGEIQTEYGAITLKKNSQFYVKQGDVEHLIAQGYLQRVG